MSHGYLVRAGQTHQDKGADCPVIHAERCDQKLELRCRPENPKEISKLPIKTFWKSSAISACVGEMRWLRWETEERDGFQPCNIYSAALSLCSTTNNYCKACSFLKQSHFLNLYYKVGIIKFAFALHVLMQQQQLLRLSPSSLGPAALLAPSSTTSLRAVSPSHHASYGYTYQTNHLYLIQLIHIKP